MESLPPSMRASVYRAKGRLEIEERALPELGPKDALIQVSHCGICGTDLHLVMEGWGRPDSIGGHEYSGTVVALGEMASGLRVGDAVVGAGDVGFQAVADMERLFGRDAKARKGCLEDLGARLPPGDMVAVAISSSGLRKLGRPAAAASGPRPRRSLPGDAASIACGASCRAPRSKPIWPSRTPSA